jgi:outer membrane lipoprotein-sorting protein
MRAKLIGCAIFVFSAAFAASSKDSLQDLLERMNAGAAKFQAMSAKVRSTSYLKVIDDTSEETGSVIMKRLGPAEIAARTEFITPDRRTLLFEKGTGMVYMPKANTVQIYDLGKFGEQVDRFLMLGFGTSGTELAHDYDMRIIGSDNIDGISTTRLEMIPKTDAVKKYLAKLELWIPDAPGQPYPIQEKIYQQSGDYQLAHYTDLKINPQIAANALELKLPPRVTKLYPQKSQ